MTEQTLIIAILVALVILWITETLGMHRTSRILGGVIDLGFAVLRQVNKRKYIDLQKQPLRIAAAVLYSVILLCGKCA